MGLAGPSGRFRRRIALYGVCFHFVFGLFRSWERSPTTDINNREDHEGGEDRCAYKKHLSGARHAKR